MSRQLVHGAHRGFHRHHLALPRQARAETSPIALREARAVAALIAVETAVLGALWVCVAAGLADTAWWRMLVVLAVIAFAGLAFALLERLRH